MFDSVDAVTFGSNFLFSYKCDIYKRWPLNLYTVNALLPAGQSL